MVEVFDQLPPHNLEAERAVLGAILLQHDCLLYARSALESPEHFYNYSHQTIYKAFLHLHDTDRNIDEITLVGYLGLTGKLDEIGGKAYLSELMGAAALKSRVEYYAEIVRGLHTQRQFILECAKQAKRGFSATDVSKYLIEGQEAITRAAQGLQAKHVQTPAQLRLAHGAWLDDLIRTKGSGVGLRFGIYELDRIAQQGLSDDLVIIAGETSMGKTSLLFSIAVNLAMAGHPGYIASMETSEERCMRRLNAIVCPHEEFMRLSRAGAWHARHELMRSYEDALSRLPLFIDDSSLYLEDLLFSIKRHMVDHPETEWIGIDYLQYMDTRRSGSEYEKINHILRAFRTLKKKLRIPIILLSQLNRNEPYGKQGLTLQNLHGSGNIGKDADMVIMLEPAPKLDEDTVSEPTMYAKVLKQRDGPVAWAKLKFVKPAFLYISHSKGREIAPEQADLLTEDDQPY